MVLGEGAAATTTATSLVRRVTAVLLPYHHSCGHRLQSEKTTGMQRGPLPKSVSVPPPPSSTSKSAPSQLSLA